MPRNVVAPEDLPSKVREIENVWIELSDGVRLAARVWLPEEAETEAVPALLEYIPYRKRDGTAARDAENQPYLAAHGYACVRVDMRGNGESGGLMEDEYLPQEQDDALEVIEWIARQLWCSGAVGMWGKSWGGFNALQVAARRPPALKAIVTVYSTDDRYADDIHYKGGALLMENLGWASTMLAYSSRPPDPALVGDRWRERWLKRLKAMPLLVEKWLEHPLRDDYWRHGSVGVNYADIEVPVLAVGGWRDAYSNAVPRLVIGLPGAVRGIVGPWIHLYPHQALPEPSIGFLQECLRWWDHWLKDAPEDPLAAPLMRVYLETDCRPGARLTEQPGRWIGVDAWPPAGTRDQTWYLTHHKLATTAPTAATLRVCSPADTGTASGEFCSLWGGPDLPTDQREDDGRSLCFDSPALDEPLSVTGAPRLDLSITSATASAYLIARLCDVHPDGTSARVSYGVLNLCHTDDHTAGRALAPDKPLRVTLQLDDLAYTFGAGHRVRLAISNAYWPLLWPLPAAGSLSLATGKDCYLRLPVWDGTGAREIDFPPAESAPPWEVEELRPVSLERTVVQDHAAGHTRVEITEDFGQHRIAPHGLVAGERVREVYTVDPNDPLTARAEIDWTEELSRNDWSVRTHTRTLMRGDAEHFHIEAKLEAFEGEELAYEHKWQRKVKRVWN